MTIFVNKQPIECIFSDDTVYLLKLKLFENNINLIPTLVKVSKNGVNFTSDNDILDTAEVSVEVLTEYKGDLQDYLYYKSNGFYDLEEEDYVFATVHYKQKNKEEIKKYIISKMQRFKFEKDDYYKSFCENITDSVDTYSETITDITLRWTPSNEVYLKLFNMFNYIEVSTEMPIVILGKKWSSNGFNYLKYHDSLESYKPTRSKYKGYHIILENVEIIFYANGVVTIQAMSQNLIEDNIKFVNDFISVVNSKDLFFTGNGRIDKLELKNSQTESISSDINTNFLIDRTKLKKFFTSEYVERYTGLSYKHTNSESILSLLYKDSVTVNVLESREVKDTSVIRILNSKGVQEIENIKKKVIYSAIAANKEVQSENVFGESKKTFKEKTTKKQLKEQNIKFDSRECQSNRQPKLTDVEAQYPESIKFKDQLYKCDNPMYPYPGFTKNNIVCCFKNDQRGTEKFIKNTNPEMLQIQVEPSNYIHDTKNVLRVHDQSFRYAYLQNKKLIPFKNQARFDNLNEDTWLEKVSLSDLVYITNKNKCVFKPDLETNDCSFHKKHVHFGYNLKGLPCCYDNLKTLSRITAVIPGTTGSVAKYIIKLPNKVLNNEQIGVLPDSIKNKISNGDYYRMGFYSLSFTSGYNKIKIIDDKIECKVDFENPNKPFVILFTRKNVTDLVIELVNNDIVKIHDRNSSIVSDILKYLQNSCKTVLDYPKNYPFEKLLPVDFYIEKLQNDSVIGSIVACVKDKSGNIIYGLSKKGVLLPVLNKVSGLPSVSFQKLLNVNKFHKYEDYISILEYLNVGVKDTFNTEIPGTLALLLDNGQVVLTKGQGKHEKTFFTRIDYSTKVDKIPLDKYQQEKIQFKESILTMLQSSKASIKNLIKKPLQLSLKLKELKTILNIPDTSAVKPAVLNSVLLEILTDIKNQLLLNGIILETSASESLITRDFEKIKNF